MRAGHTKGWMAEERKKEREEVVAISDGCDNGSTRRDRGGGGGEKGEDACGSVQLGEGGRPLTGIVNGLL